MNLKEKKRSRRKFLCEYYPICMHPLSDFVNSKPQKCFLPRNRNLWGRNFYFYLPYTSRDEVNRSLSAFGLAGVYLGVRGKIFLHYLRFLGSVLVLFESNIKGNDDDVWQWFPWGCWICVFQVCSYSGMEQTPFHCVCAALCSELSRSDVELKGTALWLRVMQIN